MKPEPNSERSTLSVLCREADTRRRLNKPGDEAPTPETRGTSPANSALCVWLREATTCDVNCLERRSTTYALTKLFFLTSSYPRDRSVTSSFLGVQFSSGRAAAWSNQAPEP